MTIDSGIFDFFEENLDQMEDLLGAFEIFKRVIGNQFAEALERSVRKELATDGWEFVRQTVGQERDFCGIRIANRPNLLQIVVSTYTRYEFPFTAPFIIIRTGTECVADMRKDLFGPVTRSAMENEPMWEEPDEYAINWWTYGEWPDTSKASQLSQLIVKDDNPLMGSLVDHLQKIKSAINEVVG